MATAIGDLVANLGIDDARWTAGLQKGTANLQKFGAGAETHVGSAHRSLHFLGREFEQAGGAVSQFSETGGKALEELGGSLSALGMAEHSVHALGKAYQWAAAQGALLSVLSGPAGWIGLAAAATAAGGAYLYFSSTSEKVTANHKEEIVEIDKLIKKIEDLEKSRHPKTGTLLEGKAREDYYQKDELKRAEDILQNTRTQIGVAQAERAKIFWTMKGPHTSEQATDNRIRLYENTKTLEMLAFREKEESLTIKNIEAKKAEQKATEELYESAAKSDARMETYEQEKLKNYEALLEKLDSEGNSIGKTAAIKEKMTLADSKLYSPEQLANLDARIDRNEQLTNSLEEQNRLWSEVAGIYGATQSAAEKYEAEIERIDDLVLSGYLDQLTAQRANDQALEKWSMAEKGQEKKTPTGKTSEGAKALEAGSQEAWKFIVEAMNPNTDLQRQIADDTRRTANATEELAANPIGEVGLTA